MTSHTRSLAVVRAEFTAVIPELLIFSGLPKFRTRFIGYTENGSEWNSFSNFEHVDVDFQIPKRLMSLTIRRPHSPASLVTLTSLQPLLNAEMIETAELYSSISNQCAKFAKCKNKKLVVTVFETLTGPSIWRMPPYAFNVARVKQMAQLFLAHSKRAASYLRSMGVPGEKISLVYPGIDLQEFSPSTERPHDGFRILFVGRFDREKGLAYLLEAFSKLYRARNDAELWILTKPSRGNVELLAREYAQRLPVRLIPRRNRVNLPRLYQECDVLCLPSVDRNWHGLRIWEEQFGFVLIEAMACGLPVIGTDCGAIPEVIGKDNPIVPQGSSVAILRELQRLSEDRELRQLLSQRNRCRAEELFDLSKQRTLTERLLSEVF